MGYDQSYYQRNKDRLNALARARYSNPEWRAKNYPNHVARARRQRLNQRARLRRICEHCQKEFAPTFGKKKYCSESCRVEAARIRVKIHRSKPEIRSQINRIQNQRYKSDPCSRLRRIVSGSVSHALKVKGNQKGGSVLDFLPYSIPQLKAHLEKFFDNTNGFSWENHGTVWHIDHVIPQCLFQYSSLDSKAFRDCWALSNLQPLEKIENIRKGGRYFPDYQI